MVSIPSSYDAVVIGAGITGASTAYHLKARGLPKVLLVERRQPAAGGTGASAAIIRHHYSNPLPVRLTVESVSMLRAMKEEIGRDGGYVAAGWYFLVPDALLAAARDNVVMQQRLGVRTGFLSYGEMEERLPWLNREGVAGVVLEPDGGYADPVQSTEAYIYGLERLGGEVRVGATCRAIQRKDSRVTGIVLDDEPIGAGAVVNAAGPWAHLIARTADIDLPIRVFREQDTVWQIAASERMPFQSISNAVDSIYLRPQGNGRFLIGRGFPKDYEEVDPDGYKETADDAFISDVRERASRRFLPFKEAALVRSYAALYDVTPDWYPVVGPRTGLSGYYDASGGSGHGFKLGFAIGRELAEWITDGRVREDFAALSYDRFPASRLFAQRYGGNRG